MVTTDKNKINDNLYVKIIEENRKKELVSYEITNSKNKIVKKFSWKGLPYTLGNQSEIYRYLMKNIIISGDVSYVDITKYGGEDGYKKRQTGKLLEELQIQYDELIDKEEQLQYSIENEIKEKYKTNYEKAKEYYQNIENPLLWIGSITDWLIADERENVILALLSNICTVILKEPISNIFHGDATNGKTNIQQIALEYIPDNYVRFEKKCTEATIFRRSEQDKYYYDGKIINFGDMGGNNDLHDAENPKSLLKELQSDGHLNRPVTVKAGDNYEIVDLELFGKPSLSYTTVPGYNFDDQEKSRSLFITPRNNLKSFRLFNKHVGINGKTYRKQLMYKKLSNLIPFMIEYLKKEVYSSLKIINPYQHIIAEYVEGTTNEKRDVKKYNNLVKAITLVNHKLHKKYKINNEEVLLVSKNDIQLLFGLLQDYQDSIKLNISKGAYTILKDIYNNYENWVVEVDGEYEDIVDYGLSVNDYLKHSKSNTYSKSTVSVYFGELNRGGYLETLGKNNRRSGYRYILTGKYEAHNEINIEMKTKDIEFLTYELGEDIKNYLENDKLDNITITDFDTNIEKPIWCD